MTKTTTQLVIGVDTHADWHVAVAVDTLGRRLATASFAASDTGNARLLAWACQHGQPVAAGVEGTGSFGYRLARYLAAHGVAVREVNRPDRARRRRVGKNDPLDAEHAARAVLAGDANAIPKNRDGVVGELRCLVVARRSAVKARTQATNQLCALLVGCDDAIRAGSGGCASSTWPAPAPGSAPPALPSSPCAPSGAAGSPWTPRSASWIGRSPGWSPGWRPGSWNATASVCIPPPSCSSPPVTTLTGWPARPPSPRCVAPARSRPPRARPPGCGSTAAGIVRPTPRCGPSPTPG
jgi:transposase